MPTIGSGASQTPAGGNRGFALPSSHPSCCNARGTATSNHLASTLTRGQVRAQRVQLTVEDNKAYIEVAARGVALYVLFRKFGKCLMDACSYRTWEEPVPREYGHGHPGDVRTKDEVRHLCRLSEVSISKGS